MTGGGAGLIHKGVFEGWALSEIFSNLIDSVIFLHAQE